MGGNNPSQIGYGCSVGSIDLNMAPSTYAPTGVALDCMLTGEGFFMVGDKIDYDIEETGTPGEDDYNRTVTGSGIRNAEGLNEPLLTRVGDFWVDADGYICNRDNKVLYGFARVQNPNYKPGATKAEIAEQKAKGIDIDATDSFTAKVYDKVMRIVGKGVNVVTTAEEMSYPKAGEPELTAKMDAAAREHGVSILGTGVNPGLIMDVLALCLSGGMTDVEFVQCKRVNSLSPFGQIGRAHV